MARRRYTAATKAKATGIAMVEGVTEASRQTDIPKVTIWQWMQKPEYEQLRTNARETVLEAFWVGIQVGVDEVVKGLRGDAQLNHKADALRTLTEKYALLNGEATSRTETRDLFDQYDDHETELLGDAIRDELARRADARPAPSTVEGASSEGADTTGG